MAPKDLIASAACALALGCGSFESPKSGAATSTSFPRPEITFAESVIIGVDDLVASADGRFAACAMRVRTDGPGLERVIAWAELPDNTTMAGEPVMSRQLVLPSKIARVGAVTRVFEGPIALSSDGLTLAFTGELASGLSAPKEIGVILLRIDSQAPGPEVPYCAVRIRSAVYPNASFAELRTPVFAMDSDTLLFQSPDPLLEPRTEQGAELDPFVVKFSVTTPGAIAVHRLECIARNSKGEYHDRNGDIGIFSPDLAVSANGQVAAFVSSARNLDDRGRALGEACYVACLTKEGGRRELRPQRVILLSVDRRGGFLPGAWHDPRMSPDGRWATVWADAGATRALAEQSGLAASEHEAPESILYDLDHDGNGILADTDPFPVLWISTVDQEGRFGVIAATRRGWAVMHFIDDRPAQVELLELSPQTGPNDAPRLRPIGALPSIPPDPWCVGAGGEVAVSCTARGPVPTIVSELFRVHQFHQE